MLVSESNPCPLRGKKMFSLYVFNTLCPSKGEVVDFYKRLGNEVRDKVSTFERNMGNRREFDPARTVDKIDSFLHGLDLKNLSKV